jgi:hypothetical protein
LGEHLLCKQGVAGSTPVISTRRKAIEPQFQNVAAMAARLFDNRIR